MEGGFVGSVEGGLEGLGSLNVVQEESAYAFCIDKLP